MTSLSAKKKKKQVDRETQTLLVHDGLEIEEYLKEAREGLWDFQKNSGRLREEIKQRLEIIRKKK